MKPIIDLNFRQVAPEAGRAWRGDGEFDFSEKMDGDAGWLCQMADGNWQMARGKCPPFQDVKKWQAGATGFQDIKNLVRVEIMPDGTAYALNIAVCDGQDVRGVTHRERINELRRVVAAVCDRRIKVKTALTESPLHILMPARGNGGEFLEAVWARGGEGVVAVAWDSTWAGNCFKCKRAQTFFCVVTARDEFRASVTLEDSVTGEARGQMPLRDRFDLCRIGSVLKIEAYGLTARGMLREARPDKDTPASWLVRF